MLKTISGAVAGAALLLSAGAVQAQVATEAAGAAAEKAVAAYQAGDLAMALQHFELAAQADTTGTVRFNMGLIHRAMGDNEAAAHHLWFAAENGDSETRKNANGLLLLIGADRYMKDDDAGAEMIFRRLLARNARNRDALHNYALALFRQQKWEPLAEVAARIVEMDPLNENARVLLYNARKGLYEAAAADPAKAAEAARLREAALGALTETDELPVHLSDAVMKGREQVELAATVRGGTAPAGSSCAIIFDFLALGKEVATVTVPVTAPAKGEEAALSAKATVGEEVDSFRYSYAPCDGWRRSSGAAG